MGCVNYNYGSVILFNRGVRSIQEFHTVNADKNKFYFIGLSTLVECLIPCVVDESTIRKPLFYIKKTCFAFSLFKVIAMKLRQVRT